MSDNKRDMIELYIEELGAVSGGGGPTVTTLAVGEEGPVVTTLALGEEGCWSSVTTLAVGEEGCEPLCS